jgi:hypothetical protein
VQLSGFIDFVPFFAIDQGRHDRFCCIVSLETPRAGDVEEARAVRILQEGNGFSIKYNVELVVCHRVLRDEIVVTRGELFRETGIGSERIVRVSADRGGYDGEEGVAENPELDGGRVTFGIATYRKGLSFQDRRRDDLGRDEGFFVYDTDRTMGGQIVELVDCVRLRHCIHCIRPGIHCTICCIPGIFPGLIRPGFCPGECQWIPTDGILIWQIKISPVIGKVGPGYEEVSGI